MTCTGRCIDGAQHNRFCPLPRMFPPPVHRRPGIYPTVYSDDPSPGVSSTIPVLFMHDDTRLMAWETRTALVSISNDRNAPPVADGRSSLRALDRMQARRGTITSTYDSTCFFSFIIFSVEEVVLLKGIHCVKCQRVC